jgi:hypothetical protein
MTTDLRPVLLSLPLVGLGWLGVLSGTLWATGQAPAILVLLPPDDLLATMPAGTAIVSSGRYSVTLSGGEGLVEALYGSGARLILPARLTGCLS